jgi:hypothetical protein
MCRRLAQSIVIRLKHRAIVFAAISMLPGMAAADIVLTPRVSYYFDNFTSLDSSVSGDPSYIQNMLNQLNSELKSALGPTANLAIASSNLALRSQQAAYKLYGATLDGRWGEGNRLYVTALTGTANVQTFLSQQFVVSSTYLSSSAQDIWTSSEVTNSALRRVDVELAYEYDDFTAGLRFEQVRQHFVGVQTTVISQNFANMVGALQGVAPDFNLASLQGTSEGDIVYNLYSARMGVSVHTAKTEEARNDFTLSAQLHVSYSPPAHAAGVLQANDATALPMILTGATERSLSAGPDVSVGYTHYFSRWLGVDFRYRAIVYFPISGALSGTQKSSDPRVNHGLMVGISLLH